VTLRARWVTLRARWVTLRARWVTLRARWATLRARWVIFTARWVCIRWCSVQQLHRGGRQRRLGALGVRVPARRLPAAAHRAASAHRGPRRPAACAAEGRGQTPGAGAAARVVRTYEGNTLDTGLRLSRCWHVAHAVGGGREPRGRPRSAARGLPEAGGRRGGSVETVLGVLARSPPLASQRAVGVFPTR
jgi:hypothetical protein